jgi:RimJ/RimL family protein N-acetyltransferase
MDDSQRPVIRVIRAGEWREAKALRLLALQDPVAHLAFTETHEAAVSRTDTFWQERTAGAADGGTTVRQFVAEAPDGGLAGTVSVLVEAPGETDFLGVPIERQQAQVVGVFVRPKYRGTGLIGELVAAAVAWGWERGAEVVRLYVHERNERAVGAYRRLGFVPSGLRIPKDDAFELELVLSKT